MEATVGRTIAGMHPGWLIPALGDKNSYQMNYRVGCLAQAALESFANVVDGNVGFWSFVLTCLTVGYCEPIRDLPPHYIVRLNFILPKAFYYIVKTFNPYANFSFQKSTGPKDEIGFPMENHGLCDAVLDFGQKGHLRRIYSAPDFITKHVISRIAVLGLSGIACVAVASDHLIALTAALLALITFGKYPSLNGIAYQYLKSPIGFLSSIILFVAFLSPPTFDSPPQTQDTKTN